MLFKAVAFAGIGLLFAQPTGLLQSVNGGSVERGEREWPELPQALTSFGAAYKAPWLYIYGGHTGEAHSYSIETTQNSFHRLNLGSGSDWEELAGGVKAQGAALVADGDYIYRAGGMAPRNKPGEDDDLHSLADFARFDVKTKSWTQLPDLPELRSSHDGVIANGWLILGGGWEMGGNLLGRKWHDSAVMIRLDKLEEGWKRVAQPFKRRALAMSATGNHIYFIGGMDEGNDTSREVDIYNIETQEWLKGPELPAGPMNGFGAAACANDGTIYVSLYNQMVLAHRPGEAEWREIARTKERRFFHRMAYLSEPKGLLLIGGASRTKGHRADMEFVPVQR